MAHGEAHAWWADVQHLHDDYERTAEARRRADRAEGARPRTAVLPARRTIEIRGRTVPAPPVPSARDRGDHRPQRPAAQRISARPDRIAMWALLLGLVLILVAVTTADAATATYPERGIAAVAAR